MSTQTLEKLPPTDTGACGTITGYSRHRQRGEHKCQACKDAYNQDRRRQGTEPRKTAKPHRPCGTAAATSRHHYHGEPPCDTCKAGERERREQKRRAQGIPQRIDPNEIIEEIEFLIRCGEGQHRILTYAGTNKTALERQLRRHNRADLIEAIFTDKTGWVGN